MADRWENKVEFIVLAEAFAGSGYRDQARFDVLDEAEQDAEERASDQTRSSQRYLPVLVGVFRPLFTYRHGVIRESVDQPAQAPLDEVECREDD